MSRLGSVWVAGVEFYVSALSRPPCATCGSRTVEHGVTCRRCREAWPDLEPAP